jgi:hypothetical protein
MAGYIRQDTTGAISNNSIIEADDLNSEFDAVEGAFNAITGHTHDGTSAEGAPIEVVGPAQDVVITASTIRPKTDNAVDLGTSTLEFKDLYLDGTANIDSLVADTADINGGTIDGTVIGGSTPAAISGTTGTFSGNLTAGTVRSDVSSTGDFNFAAYSTGGGQYRIYPDDATTANPTWLHQSNSSEDQAWVIGGVERMRIDSSGNVGIGTDSPSYELDVVGVSDTSIRVRATGAGAGDDALLRMSVGNADASSYLQFGDNSDSDAGYIRYQHTNDSLQIGVNAAERMRIDSDGNVGIGTTSPDQILHLSSAAPRLLFEETDVSQGFQIGMGGGNFFVVDNNTGSIPFTIAPSAPTNTFRIDSTGNVGIGKTPSTGIKLDVEGKVNANERLTIDHTSSGSLFIGDGASSSTSNRYISFWSDDGLRVQTRTDAGVFVSNDYIVDTDATGASAHRWFIANSERMRVTSSGNLLVGTATSVSNNRLVIEQASGDGSNSGLYMQRNGAAGTSFKIDIDSSDVVSFRRAGTQAMTIDSSGNVGIGTTDPAFALDVQDTADTTLRIKAKSSGAGNDDDAILRLDSAEAGEGLIDFYHQGVSEAGIDWVSSNKELNIRTSAGTNGVIDFQPNNNIAVRVQDPTSNGLIMGFYSEAGTYSGGIGHQDNDLWIGEGAVGLQFQLSGDDRIDPFNTDTNSVRDNAIDLGGLNSRFDDIYATNGTIQTSDRNEKQDIEALSEAEQRVAVACKGLLRKFRWKDAVAEKGDDSRIHFGIIAQDLQDAFAAEGLDAGRYAMFISSTWTDEETGEERSRMGVRYPQLLAFIIAAI